MDYTIGVLFLIMKLIDKIARKKNWKVSLYRTYKVDYIMRYSSKAKKNNENTKCISIRNWLLVTLYLSMREEAESGEIKNQNVEIEVLQA